MRQLFGRLRIDAQCVNVGLQQIAKRGVDQPVSREEGVAAEFGSRKNDPEMTLAGLGAGVSPMLFAFVDDLESYRLQVLFQRETDTGHAGGKLCAHGSTRLKGLTVTLPNTPPVT